MDNINRQSCRGQGIIPETAVFFCGAVVMVFEILGSRVLGPFLGNTVIVWTGLIGIILSSLAFGYWWGGRMADTKSSPGRLGSIIFIAACFMMLTGALSDAVLWWLSTHFNNIRLTVVIAAIVLFAPVAVLLGTVSPFVIRMRTIDSSHAGRTAGSIYAISTVGSIMGTFSAGFWLIPWAGTHKLIFGMAALLSVISLLLIWHHLWLAKSATFLLAIIFMHNSGHGQMLDFDSQYNRIRIYNAADSTGRRVRMLRLNLQAPSAIYTDDGTSYFLYPDYFRLAGYFNPGFKKTLMLGGGAYVFPNAFSKRHPEKTMDVVEIDPVLPDIAQRLFFFQKTENINLITGDARYYLQHTNKTYDVVYADVFNSAYAIPFHLCTLEFMEKLASRLNDNGVLVMNTITKWKGGAQDFLKAELKTVTTVFKDVRMYKVPGSDNSSGFYNIIIVAGKNRLDVACEPDNKQIRDMLQNEVHLKIPGKTDVLSDEYAPVSFMVSKDL